MTNIGLSLTPRSFVLGSVLISIAAVVAAVVGVNPLPVIAIALVVWVAMGLTVRGTTFRERTQRRKHVSDPYEPAQLNEQDSAGVVWVDGAATAYLELTPKQAFSVTTVSADDAVSRPPINLRLLERLIEQNDIVLDSITVISMGYRTVLARHVVGSMVSQIIGNTPVPTGGRTFLAVKLDVAASHPAVTARALNQSVPFGIHRSVLAAAARIRILIEGQGVSARVLSRGQIEELTNMVVSQVGAATDSASWSRLGEGDAAKVVSYAPGGRVTSDDQVRWMQAPAVRSYETTRLSRQTNGDVTSEYAVTFVVTDEKNSLASLGAYGLRRLNGQHKQAASRIIPLVADQPLSLPTHPVTGKYGAPTRHYPGGLGTLIGTSPEHGKVFVRIAGGTGEALYLVGPDMLTQMVLLRLSLEQVSVDVRMADDPSSAQDWQKFVEGLRSPLITFNAVPSPDVVVVPAARREAFRGTDQTVIAVASQTPKLDTNATTIVAQGKSLVVTTTLEQISVPWSPSSQERSHFFGQTSVADRAVPTAGAGPG